MASWSRYRNYELLPRFRLQLRLQLRLLSIYQILSTKSWLLKNPVWEQHAAIHVKKLVLKTKKVFVKVSSYKIYSDPELELDPERWICGSVEPESEPKEIISAPQHCYLVTFYFYQA
jgi:hypothetical protein